MLLWGTYFSGSGFKKVYRCPMRRRPVSESVDAKNLIVSDTTKDLYSCGRITHETMMRPSVFKRMQLLGAYRDTSGTPQPSPEPNAVDEKIASIQGTSATPDRPEDKPYTIWESQCELDLDQFIPAGSKFKGKGIPLPYLACIDKDSEEVLSIRRDWDEQDEECMRLRMYVKYPYVPGPGFYGTGMLNILGNSSAAMTAAWREALDCGMFANFPGGFIDKSAARQNTSNMRPGPGDFLPIDTGGRPIQQVVTELPYKDVTPGLMAMMDKITEQSRSLGQGAEIPAGEGVQNVPVGTMLAQIEQATKIMAAAHKGMHTAQSEEIELLTDLFRRNPEDFWRNNKEAPKDYWNEQRMTQALNDVRLVPVSDPNVPSHIHRVAKALGLAQLIAQPVFTPIMDAVETLKRILAAMREDTNGLIKITPPAAAPPDPMVAAKMADAQVKAQDVQVKAQKVQADAANAQNKSQLQQQELASKERMGNMDLTRELIIHQADAAKVQVAEHRNQVAEDRKHDLAVDAQAHQQAMDARRQATEEHKAGVAAVSADREHQRGLADHALEADKAAHEAAVNVHQALSPPNPAAPAKPKKK